MTKENRAAIQPGPHPIWFNALLLLDAFALGGLAVWRLVLNLLESKMVDSLPPDAIRAFTGMDHTLFPYWAVHTGISIILLLITAGGYLWLRTRSAVATALTAIIPVALIVWFWVSRT